jgi:hypothetical protein
MNMTALKVTPAQNVTDAPNRPHKKPATRLPTTLQYRDGIEDAIGWHSQDRSDFQSTVFRNEKETGEISLTHGMKTNKIPTN